MKNRQSKTYRYMYPYFWPLVESVGHWLGLICSINVPISSKFLFSYLILYLTQWTSTKEKIDLDKMQSFLEVLKTFKFAAILVHHSHQSSLLFEWVVT